MRLICYQSSTGPRVAVRTEKGYVDAGDASGRPRSIWDAINNPQAVLAAANDAPVLAANGLKFLPPVLQPQKVICVGLNYADHARETGKEPPTEPVIFCKFPTAVIAHGDPIVLPKVSEEVDYEAELVVVIGRSGRDIARNQSMHYIAGYACGHDVSARDWQTRKPGGQWLLGKSFDTFAPLGPELVTADEVPNPNDLRVQFRLNGQVMQDSRTSQFIFPIDQLIAYISSVCTLHPGDLIYTGTPPGVGVARNPKVFLKPGDTAEVEIENVGVLRNPVVAA